MIRPSVLVPRLIFPLAFLLFARCETATYGIGVSRGISNNEFDNRNTDFDTQVTTVGAYVEFPIGQMAQAAKFHEEHMRRLPLVPDPELNHEHEDDDDGVKGWINALIGREATGTERASIITAIGIAGAMILWALAKFRSEIAAIVSAILPAWLQRGSKEETPKLPEKETDK